MLMATHGADGGTGSARRRRERRLRSWLRHEQQSIAAVLATVTHHSFDKVGTASGVLRNRKTATRTGKGKEYETHYTAKFRKTPPPQAAATEYYPMTDDEGGELSAGVRPASLEEGRPQGKLQRHAGIGYEIVQNFDVPVPQMVEQLPNIVQFFAALSPVPEEVIEVPKILPNDVPMRRSCREPQLVEQLLEVSTIVSFSSLQRPVEQNVDIPVVGGSGAGGGLSGFLTEQHFSVTAATAFLEQIAESPVQSSAASSSASPGHAEQGVFRTFLVDKKRPKVARQVDEKMPRDVSSSTPAACEVHHVARDDLWVQIMTDDEPYFWHREEQTAVWRMPPGTHPAWVRSRDGLFFHVESGQVLPSLSGSF